MFRKGKRLFCLALAGLLCWSVSVQTLAEEVMPENQGQMVSQPTSEDTVSGSDGESNEGGVKLPEGSQPEVITEVLDASSMVYQSGGFGTPVRADAISTYAISSKAQLKEAMLEAVKASQKSLDVSSYGMTLNDKDEILVLFAEVLNENPELFYAQSNLGFSYFLDTGELTAINFAYSIVTEEQKQEFSRKLNEAAALVTSDMTDVEKALVLHDYLVQHCAYAYAEFSKDTLDSCPNVFDAYGALVRGKAVCQGYALAYGALLRKVGIASEMCSSSVMNHAWNVVHINGNWYHVDTTWDDPTWNREGRVYHTYFLLSDTEMAVRGHNGWTDNVECISTVYDNSYWWKDIASQIVRAGQNDYIYIKNIANGKFQVVRRTGGAAEQVLYTSTEIWGTNAGFLPVAQAYLSRQGNQIYFNDSLNIYAMEITGGTPEIVYTYDQGNGYIYGAMVYEDGTARLNIDVIPPKGDSDAYITVRLKEVVRVTGVTLDQSSVTLKEGETLKLTAAVTPENAENKGVVWKSSNEEAVSVADGVVTARKGGTAVIMVTTSDGGYTASCTVTVTCSSHTLAKVDGVAATCETDGNMEHWTCSKCGRNYADAAGTKELADADMVLKATGHSVNLWSMDGTGHWGKCNVCGKDIVKAAHMYDNDADHDCNACGYKRFYVITGGANSSYATDSEGSLTITADGDFKLFQAVEVDGKEVDRANYEVKEGSTIVTLKKAFLDTLSLGTHSIRFLYTDGKSASTQFTLQERTESVEGNDSDNDNGSDDDDDNQNYAAPAPDKVTAPKTGDNYHPVQMIMVIIVCASLMAGLIYKKKNSYGQDT